MAPEMLSVQSHDFKCDIWSMGVILYEMITKRFPFPATVNYINQLRNVNIRVIYNISYF
jgi:serine/threonine protein kinase